MSWEGNGQVVGKLGPDGDHPWKDETRGRSAKGFLEREMHKRIAWSRGSVPMISVARRSAPRSADDGGDRRLGSRQSRTKAHSTSHFFRNAHSSPSKPIHHILWKMIWIPRT